MMKSRISNFIVLIIIAAMGLPADACLWDHDTLRAEAKGLPGIADIITGRFERNPPLYYEMRLARSAKSIEGNPQDWEAYDNAGVACDRLGRHDEAIEWMKRKRTAMDAVDGPIPYDHEYRYLANLGTFQAHRWFARGANREDLSDMQRAEEFIEAAIELNPDAHFGRERYQLMAIRWIANPPERDLSIFMIDENFRTQLASVGSRVTGNLAGAGFNDAVQGMAGLVALGNAWESVDVFFALHFALSDNSDSAMAYLAKLRCTELIQNGKRSLHPRAPIGQELVDAIEHHGFLTTEESDIDDYFHKARTAADAWHKERTEFMLARLRQGLHPDTHTAFWDGYVESAAIPLPNGLLGLGSQRASQTMYVVLAVTIAAFAAIAIIFLMRRTKRRTLLAADPIASG